MIGTALTLLAFQLMLRKPQRHLIRFHTHMLRDILAVLEGIQVSAGRWQQHHLAQVVGLLRAQPEQTGSGNRYTTPKIFMYSTFIR